MAAKKKANGKDKPPEKEAPPSLYEIREMPGPGKETDPGYKPQGYKVFIKETGKSLGFFHSEEKALAFVEKLEPREVAKSE